MISSKTELENLKLGGISTLRFHSVVTDFMSLMLQVIDQVSILIFQKIK